MKSRSLGLLDTDLADNAETNVEDFLVGPRQLPINNIPLLGVFDYPPET